jgi:hypothetical protein
LRENWAESRILLEGDYRTPAWRQGCPKKAGKAPLEGRQGAARR